METETKSLSNMYPIGTALGIATRWCDDSGFQPETEEYETCLVGSLAYETGKEQARQERQEGLILCLGWYCSRLFG